VELATRLAEITPGDLRYTMYAVSGSEANERAMQLARHYWLRRGRARKYKVISLEGGYHGATQGTYGVCGLPDMVKAYAPVLPAGFAKVPPPFRRFHPDATSDRELIERSARRLVEAINAEDPETVSAFILEPIISSGGFIFPPLGWLRRVREICDEMEVLMIADEVITGFGRTGRWFACEHEDVVPDILSVAKGITSGYVPLSAAIAHQRLAEVFPSNGHEENVHPNTYAGHPVACAAALANLDIMEREGLVKNAETMGARLREGLERRLTKRRVVREVRGRGMMACVDFQEPDGSGRPLDKKRVDELNVKAWEKGAIVFARSTVLRLAPPLCISGGEVDQLIGIVGEVVDGLEASF
jgi:putrescine aminotransferase